MAKKPREAGGGDYEIGYGKPPKHSQFQPGQSGNRKGRTKGSSGLKTDLQRELAASHTIHINGGEVKGPRQQLMITTLTTRAATGDLKAIALLIPLVLQIFGIEDRGTGTAQLSAQDQGLLDFMLGLRGDDASSPQQADAEAETDTGGDGGKSADKDPPAAAAGGMDDDKEEDNG